MATENTVSRSVFFPLRVFMGLFFLHAGWQKLSGGFLGGAILKGILAKWLTGISIEEYVSFLKYFVMPHIVFFSYLVVFGEILSGLCLTLGLLVRGATLVTIFMNINFFLATMSQGGASVGSNLAFIMIAISLFWGSAGQFAGLDRLIVKRWPNLPL